jgi:hypothetical protein
MTVLHMPHSLDSGDLFSEAVDILRRLVPREQYGADASGELRSRAERRAVSREG